MSIVMNELAWAEDVLSGKDLGRRPTETFGRLAKYYIHNNYSRAETKQKLGEFLLKCDPCASKVLWDSGFEKAIKYAISTPPVCLEKIDITRSELEVISQIKSKQVRRLAFTLLCVAKYNNAVSPKNDFWVSTPEREIMQMANISTSIERQCLMYGQLRDLGMIRFSKRIDNLSVQVLFADTGTVALSVSDFRNLGYQYQRFYGEEFFTCTRCGLIEKYNNTVKGRNIKYCAECAKKVKIEYNAARQRAIRAREKSSINPDN